MDAVTFRSISSVEETSAELDSLFAADRMKRAVALAEFEAYLRRLDEATALDPPPAHDPQVFRSGVPSSLPGPEDEPEDVPWVPLPRRTTHGGDFGPRVREKLIAEAQRKAW